MQNSIRMYIPQSMVGRIIGRGGSTINRLEMESGTKIKVTNQLVQDLTILKISGCERATQKAKELIEKATMEQSAMTESLKTSNESTLDNLNWGELSKESDRLQAEQWAQLPNAKTQFYIEHPEIKTMTDDEVDSFRKLNNNISVSRIFPDKKGYKPIPNPVAKFEQCFKHFPELLCEIGKMGFEKPSPIQCQSWPVLLSGDDLIGIAQTGTGKTLAFLLPALIHIDGQPIPRSERKGPNVLIMAPTRELALQIHHEAKKIKFRQIRSVCVYGGGNRKEQINVISQGVEIIIATPGRLNDLIQSGFVNMQEVTFVVLDEADRMLDMGFEPQIRKIMLNVRPNRQTVMTSATWPASVRRLADSYMDNPVQVYIGTLNLAAVHSVTQKIQLIKNGEDEKFEMLVNWAKSMHPQDKAIVFCGMKSRANVISTDLAMLGIDCQTIHGDRDQEDREQAILDIKNDYVKILIATDVASRGIDIKNITHVINYDFPRNIEEYVHRIGRTGRAGQKGQAITYFTPKDWSHAEELIRILEEAEQFVPEELRALKKKFKSWKIRKAQGGKKKLWG